MKTLDIPETVKDALRLVHARMRERLPYAAYTAMLDTIAATPGAAHPDAARAIARERLDLLGLGTATDDEVERVLVGEATALNELPLFQRAMLVRAATMGRIVLAERHLSPLIEQPDMPEQLLEVLRHAVAFARGEVARSEPAERAVPVDVLDGLRYAHRLHALGWPTADVMAALDEVGRLPSASGWDEEIATHRRVLSAES